MSIVCQFDCLNMTNYYYMKNSINFCIFTTGSSFTGCIKTHNYKIKGTSIAEEDEQNDKEIPQIVKEDIHRKVSSTKTDILEVSKPDILESSTDSRMFIMDADRSPKSSDPDAIFDIRKASLQSSDSAFWSNRLLPSDADSGRHPSSSSTQYFSASDTLSSSSSSCATVLQQVS